MPFPLFQAREGKTLDSFNKRTQNYDEIAKKITESVLEILLPNAFSYEYWRHLLPQRTLSEIWGIFL